MSAAPVIDVTQTNEDVIGYDGATVHELPLEESSKSKKDIRDCEQAVTGNNEKYVESEYPDGGFRAWIVVVGTTFGTFSTFGYVNAWGVFQAYYEQNTLKDVSPSTIAWIGSIQYALTFIPGLITGRMFDLGYFKLPVFAASVLLIAATFLVAQCTQYWQFLLCQGFAVGISSGVIFGPQMGVIGHWFRRRRGLALGITAIGSSVGGTTFPIVAHRLIEEVGFQWTMRIIGFILLFTMSVVNICVQRRLPPKQVKGGLLNLHAFKNTAYTVYCLSGLVMFLGLYTVLTYIDVSAQSVGVSSSFSFYLLSIANASSTLGRLLAAVTADRYGCVNITAPLSALAGVMTYVWPFAHNEQSLIVVAVFYGIASGTYVSTFVMPIYEMGEIGDVGRRTGMALTITAVGALAGPPISGAINNATGGYTVVGYYAGSVVMCGVFLMLIARYMVLRKLWGKF
ncbi:MFS general substrate transporter [Fistulina hepatica ATCC 64428]|uniref:MFS general substrate transporter n=1 Tax=Fistulina hepatica ATCC 64428 TaxID=1128425 RepID=A0A0D7ADI8_9AGAR|nr:MFS general substrate transporter [Fistulina hepatica ATCC 64428]